MYFYVYHRLKDILSSPEYAEGQRSKDSALGMFIAGKGRMEAATGHVHSVFIMGYFCLWLLFPVSAQMFTSLCIAVVVVHIKIKYVCRL